MDGILKCKCARRERGYASWRFPSTIVGGAAAIPKWRGGSSATLRAGRPLSPPSPQLSSKFPSRQAGARAIIVCQVEVRLTAKFRSFPQKRESRSKIWVPAFAGMSERGLTTARRIIGLALLMVLAAVTAAVAQTAVDLQLVLAV